MNLVLKPSSPPKLTCLQYFHGQDPKDWKRHQSSYHEVIDKASRAYLNFSELHIHIDERNQAQFTLNWDFKENNQTHSAWVWLSMNDYQPERLRQDLMSRIQEIGRPIDISLDQHFQTKKGSKENLYLADLFGGVILTKK